MAELPTHTVEFEGVKMTVTPRTGLSNLVSNRVQAILIQALYPDTPLQDLPDYLYAPVLWYAELFARQVEIVGLPIPPKVSSNEALIKGYRDLFLSTEYADVAYRIHEALSEPRPEELDEKKETS